MKAFEINQLERALNMVPKQTMHKKNTSPKFYLSEINSGYQELTNFLGRDGLKKYF